MKAIKKTKDKEIPSAPDDVEPAEGSAPDVSAAEGDAGDAGPPLPPVAPRPLPPKARHAAPPVAPRKSPEEQRKRGFQGVGRWAAQRPLHAVEEWQ